MAGAIVSQVAIAQTTYGGSYYLNFYNSIPLTNGNTFGTAYVWIPFPDVNVTNFSVVLTGGVLSGCSDSTNVPYAYIENGKGQIIATATFTNGVQSVSVPVSYTGTNDYFNLFVQMPGNSTCTISGSLGGLQNLQFVAELEYQLGSADLQPHEATSYFHIPNPATNKTIVAEFDNPLSHGWQPIAGSSFPGISLVYDNFDNGSKDVGFLQNCTSAYWYLASGTQRTPNDDYVPDTGVIAWDLFSGHSTAGNTPVVLNSVFSTTDGCEDTVAEYVQYLTYAVDSSNAGPFYLTSFVEFVNPASGLTTVAYFTPQTQTGLTLRTLRGGIIQGFAPSGCTTYPTLKVKSGSTILASAPFSSSGADAVWTGSVSVSSGSEIKVVLDPGSGCTTLGQFNVIASYSIP
jgi:hypothetical protein